MWGSHANFLWCRLSFGGLVLMTVIELSCISLGLIIVLYFQGDFL